MKRESKLVHVEFLMTYKNWNHLKEGKERLLNYVSTNQRTKNIHNQNILQNGKRAADSFCFRQN